MTKKPKTTTAGRTRKDAKKPAAPARGTKERDPRLPAAGATLTRVYKGRELKVKVLAEGFEHEGKSFRSLTALAREITGYPAISGPAFFRITGGKDAAPQQAPAEKPASPKTRAPKARRAGRDPQPETTVGAARPAARRAPPALVRTSAGAHG
jgi:hypothetical protein